VRGERSKARSEKLKVKGEKREVRGDELKVKSEGREVISEKKGKYYSSSPILLINEMSIPVKALMRLKTSMSLSFFT
jgi:hypothetical protein